ncbi:MAG: spondin domain-containing protein [Isosphaeraceae bacterium]
MNFRNRRLGFVCAALLCTFFPDRSASADLLQITVTNDQGVGGLALTPLWVGLSNGTFGTFNVGSNLNGTPLEVLAELGSTAPITSAFSGFGPRATIGGGSLLPGASASTLLNVMNPGTTRFLNYASMIIPSNDLFIGNPNSVVIALFNASGQLIDANGNLTTTRTLSISGSQIWDAGTEVNAINDGGAFVAGVDATGGTPENGTAQLLFGGPMDNSAYLNSLVGVNTAAGYTVSQLLTANSSIATLTFTVVPEPSSTILAGVGIVSVLGASRIRRGFRGGRTA